MQTVAGSDITAAYGVLAKSNIETIVLALPGTDYQILLAVKSELTQKVGDRISGKIFARARRVDVTSTGGRFVEPVAGRPRRIQGRIVATDPAKNTITVQSATTFNCELTDARQKPADFAVGQIVGFDIERGARWEPIV